MTDPATQPVPVPPVPATPPVPQPPANQHVEIREEGRLVAAADIVRRDAPGVVQAALHVEAGHLPPGTRARLVDAVLDLPDLSAAGGQLEAAIPAGDAEILDRMRERCEDVRVRPAGASTLVDVDLSQPTRPTAP